MDINSHNILIDLLFNNKEKSEKNIEINEAECERLVKLASSYLVLPALYIKLKEKNLLNSIDEKLKNYLIYIYDINKNRNQNLIEEIKELSKFYIENKINHVFLKGAAYLASRRYKNIGERMIGDIDVLVAKSDYNKCIEISKKIGYNTKDLFIFDSKHYPRMTNPKKIFALEIHNRLLNKKNLLINPEDVLKSKTTSVLNINIPSTKYMILHTIYNQQINDKGNLMGIFNFRSHYDITSYETEINILLKDIRNKYLINYVLILNHLGITNINLKKSIQNKMYLFRFKIKMKYKLYRILDDFISIQIYNNRIRIRNIPRLLNSKKYREFIKRKIMKINN